MQAYELQLLKLTQRVQHLVCHVEISKMSADQQKIVDERLAQKGLFRGNTGLNRIDLPRRLHESSKYPQYEGAHQATHREGIDSPQELKRIESLSPEERFNELDKFVDNQARHRQVGQQKFMEQYQLEPGNDSSTNVFGGNFSQAILQNRDKKSTLKAGQALTKERKALQEQSTKVEPTPALASSKLQINPKAQTTGSTPKPTPQTTRESLQSLEHAPSLLVRVRAL